MGNWVLLFPGVSFAAMGLIFGWAWWRERQTRRNLALFRLQEARLREAIRNGSCVTAETIAANTVTASKIAAGTITAYTIAPRSTESDDA